MTVGWLLSYAQGRRQKVRMIVEMMIRTLFSVDSPIIGHKPMMMLGWREGVNGWCQETYDHDGM